MGGHFKNLQITAEHFKALYSQEAEHFVYDAKRVNRLPRTHRNSECPTPP